jgi:hypothetical protein
LQTFSPLDSRNTAQSPCLPTNRRNRNKVAG